VFLLLGFGLEIKPIGCLSLASCRAVDWLFNRPQTRVHNLRAIGLVVEVAFLREIHGDAGCRRNVDGELVFL
jgi:hypothetical protein